MRIILIGTVNFSRTILNCLVKLKANIVGVCSQNEAKNNADYIDLSKTAGFYGLSYLTFDDVNSSRVLQWIKSKNPDIILCVGISQLIKKPILNCPRKGVIGYHPAYLPQNRGRHPLIWALALGLDKTASTFFMMDEGADSGDIISQREIPIVYEDTASSLYKKIEKSACSQVEQILLQLTSDSLKRIPQEEKMANYWRKRGKLDGKIDWRMSAVAIYNLVRALSEPYVGAHFEFKEKEIKVLKSQVISCNCENIEPGKVMEIADKYLVIKAREKCIGVSIAENINELKLGDYL